MKNTFSLVRISTSIQSEDNGGSSENKHTKSDTIWWYYKSNIGQLLVNHE